MHLCFSAHNLSEYEESVCVNFEKRYITSTSVLVSTSHIRTPSSPNLRRLLERSICRGDPVASSASNSQQENFRTAGYAHPRRVVPHCRRDLGYMRLLVGSGWYEREGYGLSFYFPFESAFHINRIAYLFPCTVHTKFRNRENNWANLSRRRMVSLIVVRKVRAQ